MLSKRQSLATKVTGHYLTQTMVNSQHTSRISHSSNRPTEKNQEILDEDSDAIDEMKEALSKEFDGKIEAFDRKFTNDLSSNVERIDETIKSFK